MTKAIKIGGTALLSALLCAGNPFAQAVAQTPPSVHSGLSPTQIIKLFDSNSDNQIDQSEVRQKNIEVFDKIDKNRDGALSESEVPGLSARTFGSVDKDKDGKLSVYEYSQAEFLRFRGIDYNSDGVVTVQEISTFQSRERSR